MVENQTNLFKRLKPKKKKVDEGLINSCKFCVYPTNIDDKTVLIPENELETGSEELSVRHLISTYGFKIQSAIPGTIEKKTHFDPILTDKKEVVYKGLRYKKIENGFTYEVLTDKDDEGFVSILDIGSNQQPKQYFVDDLVKILKNGKYIILK